MIRVLERAVSVRLGSLALLSFHSTGIKQVRLNIYNTINLTKKGNHTLSIYPISVYVFCYSRQGNTKLH